MASLAAVTLHEARGAFAKVFLLLTGVFVVGRVVRAFLAGIATSTFGVIAAVASLAAVTLHKAGVTFAPVFLLLAGVFIVRGYILAARCGIILIKKGFRFWIFFTCIGDTSDLKSLATHSCRTGWTLGLAMVGRPASLAVASLASWVTSMATALVTLPES